MSTATGETVRFDPAPAGLRGALRVPADKALSHRAALFGAMSSGAVRVRNYLDAADTNSTLAALAALGASIERHGPGDGRAERVRRDDRRRAGPDARPHRADARGRGRAAAARRPARDGEPGGAADARRRGRAGRSLLDRLHSCRGAAGAWLARAAGGRERQLDADRLPADRAADGRADDRARRRPRVEVEGMDAAVVSYPGFAADLGSLLGR